MRLIKAVLFGFSLCLCALVQAQGMAGDRSKQEVIKMGLYPPDIIMRHQQRLGITDDQRANILKAVRTFQSDVAELQWNMQNGQQLMLQSFSDYPIKTDQALAQAEQVLEMESGFKLAHFKLLIAIKNTLTQEQIALINEGIEERRAQKGS